MLGKSTKLGLDSAAVMGDTFRVFFSVPPAGYTTQKLRMDLSPPEEKDLIETLRRYSEQGGGVFPDELDLQAVFRSTSTSTLKNGKITHERSMQDELNAHKKLTSGLDFIQRLSPEADAHYAGKGVLFGTPDKPIFWYRPKDAKKYRVIYADLSVRDANAPPIVPNAQPVPDAAKPK